MNDKLKEALQALADVMEKYGIELGQYQEYIFIEVAGCTESAYVHEEDTLTAEYLKEALRDDD